MNAPHLPTRWIRWLSKIGCSIRELVDVMHRWEKKEVSHIQHALYELGHTTSTIEHHTKHLYQTDYLHPYDDPPILEQSTQDDHSDHINQNIQEDTSNNHPQDSQSMAQIDNTPHSGLLDSLEQLMQRIDVQGKADIGHLATQLKAVGFTASEIAHGLKHHVQADAKGIVKALHHAEFSLHEIGTTLKHDLQLGVTEIAHHLKDIEADAHKVIQTIQKDFAIGKAEVQKILHEVFVFPGEEIHKIMHSLGLIEQKIEGAIDHVKADVGHAIHHIEDGVKNIVHHLLNPLHWFKKHHADTSDPTKAHAFLKNIQNDPELQHKLTNVQDSYMNTVVSLAHDAGHAITKAELATALGNTK